MCYSTRKHIICAFYTTLYPNAYTYNGKFYAVIRIITEYSGKKSQVSQHLVQTSHDVRIESFPCCILQSFLPFFGLGFVERHRIQELNQWHIQDEIPLGAITFDNLVNYLQPNYWTLVNCSVISFICPFKEQRIFFNNSG